LYICICNAVTEKAVRECARNGACSLDQLAFELGVGAGCGRCRDCASELLRDAQAEEPLLAAAA
jgi:bacterioferritin-associated ferredoxin